MSKDWWKNMDSFKQYITDLGASLEKLPHEFEVMKVVAEMMTQADQIVCVGVGKSGYVAQKLNASLVSLALNSMYLHPAEAVHGDIGNVADGSVVVLFSKSGNSSEINTIIPFLKKRKCRLVGVGNSRDSVLGESSDYYISINVACEGEPLNILPLVSIDVSMVIANAITAQVSQFKGLSVDAFARNHPGGQLGRNISLTIGDLPLWRSRSAFVTKETSVMDAIIVDSQHRAGLVCVVDLSHNLLGVMSDGDIRRAIHEDLDLKKVSVEVLMNTNPVTLSPSLLVGEAIDAMELGGRKVFSAPVVNGEGLCLGVVTLHDLIR